jgi:hypothetical protein
VALPANNLSSGSAGHTARISNPGTTEVFLAFGDSTVVATTSGMSMPPGSLDVVTLPAGTTHVAALTEAGTANVRICLGAGV